ncbi:MAG TPA: hypothetical protein ENI23_08015 [bacterium]|nr:hypothetical protein [bacterium]
MENTEISNPILNEIPDICMSDQMRIEIMNEHINKIYTDKFLAEIDSKLSDFPDTRDLVDIGIFTTIEQGFYARKGGYSPPYFKMSPKRMVYPKKQLLKWLEKRANSSP